MPNTIYLSRHGQSEYNLLDKIGGDSSISKNGQEYAKSLFEYVNSNENIHEIKIYTSQLKRTKETAQYFPEENKENLDYLNEINAGIFEDFTYLEIKDKYFDEYIRRKEDKYNYRYPSGESYKDLKNRVLEIFKKINNDYTNVLIICHNAVARIIYSVLQNIDDNDEIPYIDIPLHTLFKFDFDYNQYKLTEIDLSNIN